MTLANMVLARDLLTLLDEHHIEFALGLLNGDPMRLELHDELAVISFAKELRCVFGTAQPLARALNAVLDAQSQRVRPP